jgi:sigma-B regulation protein RsbU (phosphoserine phosphatase)
VVGPLQRNFLEIGLAATAILTYCALLGFRLIHHHILQPLAALSRAACSISLTARLHPAADDDPHKIHLQRQQAEAGLDSIKAIRTGDEVESLAGDFAVITSRILNYHHELESEVAAKTAAMRQDLDLAREFQLALLPAHYPAAPPDASHNPLRLQFAHFYQPASTVGGDFFDLIELDENRVAILIADVMGHGARSALVTAILRALVRNRSTGSADPGTFLTELNRQLREIISRSGQTLFVTAFFLVLDTRQAIASWAVAGHPSPMRVRRGSGKPPEPLWTEPQHQPALGLLDEARFLTTESPLKANEVFLLFTDGLTEAENPAGDNFGAARLATSFDQALDGPMAAMPAKIVCDVTAFQKRHHYDDDICLVAVEAVGANDPMTES